MKKLVCYFFVIFIFSCSKNKHENISLNQSYGNRNEVVLVLDDSLWIGLMGDSIRAKLAQPISDRGYFEPTFDLIQLDPKIFTTKAKSARNIVLFSTDTEHEFLLQKSVYATPQNFFFLRAANSQDLLKMFHKRADSIINVFKSFIKSFGPIPNAATAIDGSTKYLVSEVLIAVLLLMLGFQASISSIMYNFFKTFR